MSAPFNLEKPLLEQVCFLTRAGKKIILLRAGELVDQEFAKKYEHCSSLVLEEVALPKHIERWGMAFKKLAETVHAKEGLTAQDTILSLFTELYLGKKATHSALDYVYACHDHFLPFTETELAPFFQINSELTRRSMLQASMAVLFALTKGMHQHTVLETLYRSSFFRGLLLFERNLFQDQLRPQNSELPRAVSARSECPRPYLSVLQTLEPEELTQDLSACLALSQSLFPQAPDYTPKDGFWDLSERFQKISAQAGDESYLKHFLQHTQQQLTSHAEAL